MLDTIYDGVYDFIIAFCSLLEDGGFLMEHLAIFTQIISAVVLFSFVLVLFYIPFAVFRLVVRFIYDS